MSIKLCCALPLTLNCLKSARTLLTTFENVNSVRSPIQQTAVSILNSRGFSSDSAKKASTPDKQKNLYKKMYSAPLTAHVKSVKVFSISSSIVGILAQPILYKEIVSTGNVPVIIAAYSFIGFFTIITPLLLHFITKKYITELSYNEDTNTYLIKSLNFFSITKEMEFKLEDVYVPDVPGMFVTFHIKGKPFFVDPRFFDNPHHYGKLMGFDKPMDFKLLDKHENTADTADPSSNKT
ncbi:transmembrane protein 70 homolog, mitochondrial [Euwallacea fornicatus]|uniref:transmembrane protein 70 homolog, mitochondrial n=1 Tax=Euwallacea fornicatus TaxID=995702 RepID=UPI00338FA5D9